MRAEILAAIATLTLAFPTAHAHGDAEHQAKSRNLAPSAEATAFGRAGVPEKVTRTVTIRMSDRMRFTPASVSVKQGETIRFVVRNDGKMMHELVLGTDEHLRKHAELMRKFPGMEHDEAYMVHVKPAATGDIVWTFDQAGEFGFACLVPGHYEAGMVGKVAVK